MENKNYKTEKTIVGITTTHPSFGTIEFDRVNGNSTSLFGSSIKHRDTIIMKVSHADITRGLNSDHFFADKPIVEIEMSQSQFAEAITSMNHSNGVPVTIRYTEKDGFINGCNFVNKKEQFVNEFKEEKDKIMKNSRQLIQEVCELFNKKSLTKSDKENILSKLSMLNKDIGSNMDFVVRQFHEQMDKTVNESKGEIEAFFQNKVNSIANNTLVEHREELLKLDSPVDIDEI